MTPVICATSESPDIQLDLAGPHLVRAAEICIDEPEVQADIIRTLSVLSEQDKCCDAIADMAARLGILIGQARTGARSVNGNESAIKPIPERSIGVLSRIGYILGNIMARSDSARLQFFDNDVAMECLLSNLEMFATSRFSLKRRATDAGDGSDEAADGGDTVVDVLIKLIRVIANMSINPAVGLGLAGANPLGSVMLTLLLTINKFKCNFVSVRPPVHCVRLIETDSFAERRDGGAAARVPRRHPQPVLLPERRGRPERVQGEQHGRAGGRHQRGALRDLPGRAGVRAGGSGPRARQLDALAIGQSGRLQGGRAPAPRQESGVERLRYHWDVMRRPRQHAERLGAAGAVQGNERSAAAAGRAAARRHERRLAAGIDCLPGDVELFARHGQCDWRARRGRGRLHLRRLARVSGQVLLHCCG